MEVNGLDRRLRSELWLPASSLDLSNQECLGHVLIAEVEGESLAIRERNFGFVVRQRGAMLECPVNPSREATQARQTSHEGLESHPATLVAVV
jgi:hypothetical protein